MDRCCHIRTCVWPLAVTWEVPDVCRIHSSRVALSRSNKRIMRGWAPQSPIPRKNGCAVGGLLWLLNQNLLRALRPATWLGF